MLFERARMPSIAGYSYGRCSKDKTDPNLTPNPIRTHDRAPNPKRPTSEKNFVPGGSRTRDPEAKWYYVARAL